MAPTSFRAILPGAGQDWRGCRQRTRRFLRPARVSAEATGSFSQYIKQILFLPRNYASYCRANQSWDSECRYCVFGGGGLTIVESFRQTGVQSGTNFVDGLTPIAPQVTSFFQGLYQQIVSIFSTPIPVTFDSRSPLQSTAPFAAGGLVRGPGTGTSDSILAFLSNPEFVVNARAVSHYGPALFAALNAMRLPKDFIGRFAIGGLARSGGNRRPPAPSALRQSGGTKRRSAEFQHDGGDDDRPPQALRRYGADIVHRRKPRWLMSDSTLLALTRITIPTMPSAVCSPICNW